MYKLCFFSGVALCRKEDCAVCVEFSTYADDFSEAVNDILDQIFHQVGVYPVSIIIDKNI